MLDQELAKTIAARETASRQARLRAGGGIIPHIDDNNKENTPDHLQKLEMLKQQDKIAVKKDFFGRIIVPKPVLKDSSGNGTKNTGADGEKKDRVWVTYHEGINNAVRKPISLEEFLRGF